MASMRAKRARRVAAWPVTKRRQTKFAKGGVLPADVRLYGREGPELEYAGPACEIQLKRRPWLQRFIRSYRGWRQQLGIVQSLRAAWRVSTLRLNVGVDQGAATGDLTGAVWLGRHEQPRA